MSVTAATGIPARATIAADRVTVPAKWWATLGAAILVFQAFVLIRWLTGPYFKHVEPGPTPLPGWMKIALTSCQIVLPVAGIWCLY